MLNKSTNGRIVVREATSSERSTPRSRRTRSAPPTPRPRAFESYPESHLESCVSLDHGITYIPTPRSSQADGSNNTCASTRKVFIQPFNSDSKLTEDNLAEHNRVCGEMTSEELFDRPIKVKRLALIDNGKFMLNCGSLSWPLYRLGQDARHNMAYRIEDPFRRACATLGVYSLELDKIKTPSDKELQRFARGIHKCQLMRVDSYDTRHNAICEDARDAVHHIINFVTQSRLNLTGKNRFASDNAAWVKPVQARRREWTRLKRLFGSEDTYDKSKDQYIYDIKQLEKELDNCSKELMRYHEYERAPRNIYAVNKWSVASRDLADQQERSGRRNGRIVGKDDLLNSFWDLDKSLRDKFDSLKPSVRYSLIDLYTRGKVGHVNRKRLEMQLYQHDSIAKSIQESIKTLEDHLWHHTILIHAKHMDMHVDEYISTTGRIAMVDHLDAEKVSVPRMRGYNPSHRPAIEAIRDTLAYSRDKLQTTPNTHTARHGAGKTTTGQIEHVILDGISGVVKRQDVAEELSTVTTSIVIAETFLRGESSICTPLNTRPECSSISRARLQASCGIVQNTNYTSESDTVAIAIDAIDRPEFPELEAIDDKYRKSRQEEHASKCKEIIMNAHKTKGMSYTDKQLAKKQKRSAVKAIPDLLDCTIVYKTPNWVMWQASSGRRLIHYVHTRDISYRPQYPDYKIQKKLFKGERITSDKRDAMIEGQRADAMPLKDRSADVSFLKRVTDMDNPPISKRRKIQEDTLICDMDTPVTIESRASTISL